MMIVAGIMLPVVVVLLFALATVLPRWFTEPPSYDLLLTYPGYGSDRKFPGRIELIVLDERLYAHVYQVKNGQENYVPKLLMYNAGLQEVREITLAIPENVGELPDGTELPIPGIKQRSISASLQAPDGYEFEVYNDRGGGLITELFINNRRRYGPRVVKNGAVIRLQLPAPTSRYYNYYNMRFLGWVIE